MPSLNEIRDHLQHRTPALLDVSHRTHAAVALLLYEGEFGPEILFIERTENDQDPWSGHLGFPGGRTEEIDPGPKETAQRETWEEVGVDLRQAEYLGRLDDLLAANRPVVVSCFVFAVGERPDLALNPAEVADAFWFPLEKLSDPTRRRKKPYQLEGEKLEFPAVQLLDDHRPYLWGLTYRLTVQFLEATGRLP